MDLPSKSTGTFSVRWPPSERRMLSAGNQSYSATASSADFSNTKTESNFLDVIKKSHTDFMSKLLVENEERLQKLMVDSGNGNQTEFIQKVLAENESRLQRLLADSSKRSQAENEERLQKLLVDSGKVD